MAALTRPGPAIARRPLHFIWLCDCSGSMAADGKINALNSAIRETIPHMRNVARDNPHAEVLVRAVRFGATAAWQVEEPTPVASFDWSEDLVAGGETAMGGALNLVAQQLAMPPMEQRALPPVLALVSDGQPTDDFAGALRSLMSLPWGQKAVRVAVAIGQDADRDVLQNFIGNSSMAPLEANNPEALIRSLRWISTAVVKQVSVPTTAQADPLTPPPPPATQSGTDQDVW